MNKIFSERDWYVSSNTSESNRTMVSLMKIDDLSSRTQSIVSPDSGIHRLPMSKPNSLHWKIQEDTEMAIFTCKAKAASSR